MLRHVVIPDIHGREFWLRILSENPIKETDKFVFLGDYTDSFDKTNDQIYTNLQHIINFKYDNYDKVVLLLGNHDIQYFNADINDPNQYICSGYRPEAHHSLHRLFNDNERLFQYAYQCEDYIFTHAGIHAGWFLQRFKGSLDNNIAEQLNNPSSREEYNTLFDIGYSRWGAFPVGGPFWCDKQELCKPIPNYNQIVGHTRVKKIITQTRKDSIVWFTDCFPDNPQVNLEYLTLDI